MSRVERIARMQGGCKYCTAMRNIDVLADVGLRIVASETTCPAGHFYGYPENAEVRAILLAKIRGEA